MSRCIDDASSTDRTGCANNPFNQGGAMRRNQYTLKASGVYKRVCGLLVGGLGLKPYKRSVPETLLAALLLLAAFTHSSVHAAVQLHPDAPSYQSVRSALHANLPCG